MDGPSHSGTRRRYLVLAPMPVELRPVLRAFGLRSAPDGTHRGRIGDAEVVAALAGIGPDAAAEATRTRTTAIGPDHVVVVGVAGGVRHDLAVGSLLVPATVATHAPGGALTATFTAHPLGDAVRSGALITTRELITDPAVHEAHRKAGFDAVDMETSAIAEVAEELGVPWTAFRGISDHVDEGLLADPDILGLLGPDGAPRPGRAAALVVRRPSVVRSFARLASGTRAATRAATAAARRAIERDAARR